MRVPPGGGTAEVFARGVRNGTGLAVAPDGAVWTAVNNRDNIAYPFDARLRRATEDVAGEVIAVVRQRPPGRGAGPALTPGRDLGWPYCNPDPDRARGWRARREYTTRPFVNDIQTNPGGTKLDCAALPPVEQGLGAHSAPLGLSFVTTGLPAPSGRARWSASTARGTASPPGARGLVLPVDGGTLGPQQTLLGGFQAADGTRWGRPVDGGRARTARCTSATTRPTPSTGWPRRDADHLNR